MQKPIKGKLAEIKNKAVKHVGALSVARGVRLNEANNPEGDCEDEGADRQQKVAGQSHQGRARGGACFRCLFFLQLVDRLDPDQSDLSLWPRIRSPEYLIGGVKDHFQEWHRHSKKHPDINHLDIGSDRQALGKSQKTTKIALH